jgi:NADH:ubiquinone oxidoreductase subunit 3 (subunit A)
MRGLFRRLRDGKKHEPQIAGEDMLNDWLFIGLIVLLAPIFPTIALIIPRLIAPRKPHPLKSQTYECGIETVGDTWVQFKTQYYNFGLIFLIFDVEIVFLFPWAVAFNHLPLFAVFEGILFIVILIGGLLYAWKKGVLEWY